MLAFLHVVRTLRCEDEGQTSLSDFVTIPGVKERTQLEKAKLLRERTELQAVRTTHRRLSHWPPDRLGP